MKKLFSNLVILPRDALFNRLFVCPRNGHDWGLEKWAHDRTEVVCDFLCFRCGKRRQLRAGFFLLKKDYEGKYPTLPKKCGESKDGEHHFGFANFQPGGQIELNYMCNRCGEEIYWPPPEFAKEKGIKVCQ